MLARPIVRSAEKRLLWLILLFAAALRAADLFHIPFMHDELSALIRAQAGSFSELIEKAKTSDVHPLGVHVFVHYWSALVGEREWLIKLPFIICSVLAVFQAFRLAAKWFNPTVGLLTAACMASLQFTVMYGQLERPYASGILFVLLLANAQTDYLFSEKQKETRTLIRFVFAAALCSYDHYFCLLSAGIIGVSGFFVLPAEKRKKYVFACFASVLLFLPHLTITLYQFSEGQKQSDWWISAPTYDWILHFFNYLFHYSKTEMIVVVSIVVLGLILRDNKRSVFDRFRLLAIVYGFVPFLIIFIYSKLNSPVLQLSSMTFSVPFILIGLFSFFRELAPKTRIPLVLILVITSTGSLLLVRKHMLVFYHQPYEEMAKMSRSYDQKYGNSAVISMHRVGEGLLDYYERKLGSFNYQRTDFSEEKTMQKILDTTTANYFVAGDLPENDYPLIRKRFPYLIDEVYGFTCDVRVYSKLPSPTTIVEHQDELLNKKYRNAAGQGDFLIDSLTEFGPTEEIRLMPFIKSRYTLIELSVKLTTHDSSASPLLVFDLTDEGRKLLYSTAEQTKKGAGEISLVVPLYDVPLEKGKEPKLKIYVWNRNHQQLFLKSLRVCLRPGNSYIYGLYEPF